VGEVLLELGWLPHFPGKDAAYNAGAQGMSLQARALNSGNEKL
jgi:hypothetical protein